MKFVPREILILEDEEVTRLLLRKILEGAGYIVHEASTIQEAIQTTEARTPHLVIVDLYLGQDDGFRYIDFLSNSDNFSDIPVIVASASKDKKTVLAAITMGVCDFILKPFDTITLTRKIRKILLNRYIDAESGKQKFKFRAKIRAKGNMVKMNEVSCLLEAPVRFSPGTPIKFRADFINSIGWDKAYFVKSGTPTPSVQTGQTLNLLIAVGQEPSNVPVVRTKIRGWKNG